MLDFHYSKNTDELDDLLEEFKKNREGVVDDNGSAAAKHVYRQTQKFDWLIPMDDVSHIADKSNSPISYSFLENLNTTVYTSFILFIQKNKYGN